jgi:soluble lytic murein transglycosylase-like protein
LPSKSVQASCETPVAGISPLLATIEENPIALHIDYYSTIYGVDSELVQAVIDTESHGRAKAHHINTNGSHDAGLMQINSCNHEWLRNELGITDFYDAQQNIQCGCYILGLLSKKYESVNRVLMSYNMGEYRTSQLWQSGIYSSEYSRKVVQKMKEVN